MSEVPAATREQASNGWSTARGLALEEMSVGDWVSFDAVFREADLDSFAELTGDASPIHVSHEYAQDAGFPGRIVHGMLAASTLSTVVGMFLPGRRAMLMSQKTDFIEPIVVGSRVTITARVHHISPATRSITLAFLLLRGGVVAIRGTVSARVREDSR